MQDLQKDAALLAALANAISKAIHGGILAAWDVVSALLAMRSIDLQAFKTEVAGLVDLTERQAVEQAFVGALALQDASVQQKIVSSVNVLESGIQYIQQGFESLQRNSNSNRRSQTNRHRPIGGFKCPHGS